MSSTARVEGRPSGNAVGRWFADRRVGLKFAMLIGVVMAAAVAVGVVGLLGMATMQRSSDAIYGGNLVPITELAQSRAAALSMRSDVLNSGITADTATVRKWAGKIPDDGAAFDKAFGTYMANAPTTRAAHIAAVTDGMRAYRQVRDTKLLPAALRGDARTFGEVRDGEGAPAFAKLSDALNSLVHTEIASAGTQNAHSKSTYASSRLTMTGFLVGGLVLGVAFGVFIARLVTRPVSKVAVVLTALAEGDLTRSADVTSADELGRMAAAADQACTRLREMIAAVSANSHTLAGAAQQLSAASQQLSAGVEETTAQATTVSAAAEEVSRNIQTVSAASEEMSASIQEISGSATEAAGVAQQAMSAAEAATTTVSQLGASSAEIGHVIRTITTIAEQTNLLALNATIEAARAGEAGRGFAVVASEVKDLAQETSRATDDISRRIEAIQTDAGAAVEVIAEITSVIKSINGYSTTIAAAVEEQTATTGEIGRNVTQAACGSGEIAENITGVASAVKNSTSALDDTRRSVEELARMSTDLQQLVGQFRY